MITLSAIWESSTGLLKRFELTPPAWTAWHKVSEEYFEAIESLHDLKDKPRNEIFKMDTACEVADFVVTLVNLGYACGCQWRDFENIDIKKQWDAAVVSELKPRDRWIALQDTLYLINQSLNALDALEGDSSLSDIEHHRARIARRIGDSIRAMFRVCCVQALTYDNFEAAMESTIYKNNNKTDKTHVVIDGFIKRIQPVILTEEK